MREICYEMSFQRDTDRLVLYFAKVNRELRKAREIFPTEGKTLRKYVIKRNQLESFKLKEMWLKCLVIIFKKKLQKDKNRVENITYHHVYVQKNQILNTHRQYFLSKLYKRKRLQKLYQLNTQLKTRVSCKKEHIIKSRNSTPEARLIVFIKLNFVSTLDCESEAYLHFETLLL